MNSFSLEIWNDEGRRCSFYTVRLEGAEDNEMDRFLMQYEDPKNEFHEASNIILLLVLKNIGDKYGAINDFFDRVKNEVQALPPKPKRRILEIEQIGFNFPLRLYCYRISNSLVVLFNGGIKDARTDQESKDISYKFYEAQTFAKKIQEAIEAEMVVFSENGRIMTDFQGNKEIFL